MVQVEKVTYKEQVKMYNKLNKKELIKMLIECNRVIDVLRTIANSGTTNIHFDTVKPEPPSCATTFNNSIGTGGNLY